MRAPAVARPAESAPTLFDEHPDADPYVVPADADLMVGLLDALLTSEVYALQRRRAERAALDDERVRSLLMALLRNNGRLHETTLAGVAQVPVARMRTVLAAVRKLLNVEGYDVLSLDADQVTVVLDVALLREQFHLGRSR